MSNTKLILQGKEHEHDHAKQHNINNTCKI